MVFFQNSSISVIFQSHDKYIAVSNKGSHLRMYHCNIRRELDDHPVFIPNNREMSSSLSRGRITFHAIMVFLF